MDIKAFIFLLCLINVVFGQITRNVVSSGGSFYFCVNAGGLQNRCGSAGNHSSLTDALSCARNDITNGATSVTIYVAAGLLSEYCLTSSCGQLGGGGTTACFCGDITCSAAAAGTCTGNTLAIRSTTGAAFTSATLNIISEGATTIDFQNCTGLSNVLMSFTGTSAVNIQGITFANFRGQLTTATCTQFGTATQCVNNGCNWNGGNCRNPTLTNGGILAMTAGQLTLTDTGATNNYATNGGFAYLTSGTSVLVNGGTFKNNRAATNGGAFYIDGTTATVASVQMNQANFVGNYACQATSCSGGALFINTNVQITVDTSNFTSNSAGNGGAIYVGRDTGNLLYLTSTSTTNGLTNFISNTAQNGGAIWFYGEILSINRCNISANNATIGGGLYVQDISLFGSTSVPVGSSFFNANSAVGDNTGRGGGAIFTSRKLTTTQTSFTGNYVIDGNGGAIYIVQGNVEIATCIFSKNKANMVTGGGNGGAVYSSGSSSIDDSFRSRQSYFSSNTAAKAGGAVYMSTQTWDFSTCSFISNTAGTYGGAIYSASLEGTIEQGTGFSGNTADSGGAVYTTGNLNVDGSAGQVTFTNNNANVNNGGAIACISTPATNIDYILTISSSALNHNLATLYGGAVYSSCTTIMKTDTFDSNYAGNSGAAFYCASASKQTGLPCQITVDTCTFNNGSSPGAGSFAADGNYIITGSTFSMNSNLIIPASQSAYGITTKITSCTFTTASNISANSATIITKSTFDMSRINAYASLDITQTTFYDNSVCNCDVGCIGSISQDSKFSSSTLTNTGSMAVKGVDFSSSSLLSNEPTGTITTDSSTTFSSSTIINKNTAAYSANFSGSAQGSVLNNPTDANTVLNGFAFTSSTINNNGTISIKQVAQCIALDTTNFINRGSVYLSQNCPVTSVSSKTSSFTNMGSLTLNGVHNWVPDFTGTNTSTIELHITDKTTYDIVKFQDAPEFGKCQLNVNWNQPTPIPDETLAVMTWQSGSLSSNTHPKINYIPSTITTSAKIGVRYNPQDVTFYSPAMKLAMTAISVLVGFAIHVLF